MLSKGAFNALLKTLEEPPPHIILCLQQQSPKRFQRRFCRVFNVLIQENNHTDRYGQTL